MQEGFILTGLGMAWVFIFLGLMILFMTLSSKIIQKFFPEPPERPKEPSNQRSDLEKTAAVIAIARYHQKKDSK